MKSQFSRASRGGQTMVEYVIVLAALVLAGFVGFKSLGSAIGNQVAGVTGNGHSMSSGAGTSGGSTAPSKCTSKATYLTCE